VSEQESLLRLPGVLKRTSMSRSGVYAGMMAHTFPRAIKRRSTPLWLESEVDAWIARQVETLPRMGRSVGRNRKSVLSI
jgi:predicted DNA-binding transcriptional regulator AlpA